ncbi:hypothetical protein FJ250_03150 [bacterium]|nr:hypothetical protein [bacterium]
MFSKKCPSCGYGFTLRRFLGLRSYRFTCPGCGAPLAMDYRRAVIAIFLQAPLFSWALTQAFRNPWYWLAMPAVFGASFVIHYVCFAVAADGPRGK